MYMLHVHTLVHDSSMNEYLVHHTLCIGQPHLMEVTTDPVDVAMFLEPLNDKVVQGPGQNRI